MTLHKSYGSLAFVALLAACSPGEIPPTGSRFADNFRVVVGDWDVEEVKSLPRPEGAFEATLFDEFIRLGAAERAEADWRDTTFFLNRARRLSQGGRVNPSQLGERRLPEDSIAEFADARRRLMSVLASQRVWKQPVDAANAQAAYECWLQEREENFQDQDIARCRETFLARMETLEATKPRTLVVLLPDLDGNVGEIEFSNVAGSRTLTRSRAAVSANQAAAAPSAAFDVEESTLEQTFGTAIKAQPVPPDRFIVFFELNSSELSEAAAGQIPLIVESISRHPAAEVEIIGHADRSGSTAFNDALSLSRANSIRRRLIDRLTDNGTARITALGESDPLVDTPDGVAEPQNRRVEVTVR